MFCFCEAKIVKKKESNEKNEVFYRIKKNEVNFIVLSSFIIPLSRTFELIENDFVLKTDYALNAQI